MTPTLVGRWETRTFLMGTLGAFITLGFGWLYRDFATPFALLVYALCLGYIWDSAYTILQSHRWDRDWPPIFFCIGGFLEGLYLWGFTQITPLWHLFGWPSLLGVSPRLTFLQFAAHYSTVWLVTFLVMLGPLKIIWLHWRFQGGEWLKG